jgi:hypothetical protein
MNNLPTQLFTAKNADGNSGTFKSKGGFVTLLANGTFGSGTLTVQASPDDGTTWISTIATMTAAGVINFLAGDGVLYRLNLSGSTAPSLNAWVAYEQ